MLSISLRASRLTPVILSLSQRPTRSITVATTRDAFAIPGSWMRRTASWANLTKKNSYLRPKTVRRMSLRRKVNSRSNKSRLKKAKKHRLTLRKSRVNNSRSLHKRRSLSCRRARLRPPRNLMCIRLTCRKDPIHSSLPSGRKKISALTRNQQLLLRLRLLPQKNLQLAPLQHPSAPWQQLSWSLSSDQRPNGAAAAASTAFSASFP